MSRITKKINKTDSLLYFHSSHEFKIQLSFIEGAKHIENYKLLVLLKIGMIYILFFICYSDLQNRQFYVYFMNQVRTYKLFRALTLLNHVVMKCENVSFIKQN